MDEVERISSVSTRCVKRQEK